MKSFTIIATAIFSILLLSAGAFGQCVSLTTSGSASTQNFDTLSNTAASTTNNLTIPGWFMTESGGGARDNEQYAVDTGASTTGDTYSYGAAAATDRALGGLRSGTLIPIFGSCYTNNTGAAISSLAIAYTGEEWRLGTAARTDQINFEYSTNATDLVTGTWTGVSALNFVTPDMATAGAKNGNAAADRTALSSTISSLSIANGATFWVRWTDIDATGADDGLAVDDFSLTPTVVVPAPNLSINDVSLNEGNAGTTNFIFTVSLSAPAPAGGVTFDIATANGTATAADGDFVQRFLTAQTIPAGASTYSFTVPVNGDTTLEPNETFFVNVTNVTGAIVTDGQGQGTIVNDDALPPPPTVQLDSVSYSVDESQTLEIFVSRSGDTSGTTTVDYSTYTMDALGVIYTAVGGAACTSGVDYITQSGTLTFGPKEEFKSVEIPICGDRLEENDETFPFRLSNVTNGNLGKPSLATVTINDTANQFTNTESIRWFSETFPYPATIDVTGAPTTIGSMRVTLYNLFEPAPDDIDVLLVGPQGQNIILMADAGGFGKGSGGTLTFEDQAGQVLPDSTPISTGKYEPTSWEAGQPSFPAAFGNNPSPPPAPYNEPGSTVGGPVTLSSIFGGTNANGQWRLYVRVEPTTKFQPVESLGIRGGFFGGWGLEFIGPTAAGVSVAGRVRTGNTGIPNAIVTVTGGNLTQPLVTRTNSFGNYRVEGLPAGQTYILTVAAKRYTFTQPSIVLNVGDDVANADFVAEEQ